MHLFTFLLIKNHGQIISQVGWIGEDSPRRPRKFEKGNSVDSLASVISFDKSANRLETRDVNQSNRRVMSN